MPPDLLLSVMADYSLKKQGEATYPMTSAVHINFLKPCFRKLLVIERNMVCWKIKFEYFIVSTNVFLIIRAWNRCLFCGWNKVGITATLPPIPCSVMAEHWQREEAIFSTVSAWRQAAIPSLLQTLHSPHVDLLQI